jgi:hypothetical protein
MRLFLALILFAHGVAHLVGFAVAWRLTAPPDMPYRTTLLGGRVDVGDIGIRIAGTLWLLVAIGCLAAGASVALQAHWAPALMVSVLAASAVLCALEWDRAWIGLVVSVLLLAVSPAAGSWAWRADAEDAERRLIAATSVAQPASTTAAPHARQLPLVVGRFLDRVLQEGQPDIRIAELVQEGEFFIGGAWRRLDATERFTVEPPGFVWDARIEVARLPIYVADRYIGGIASMRGTFLGLYPVVDVPGGRELRAAALLRYLAESIWFPTALRPNDRLRWEGIDEQRARATLTDAQAAVSAEFRFNTDGDVVEIFAPDRLRELDGSYVPTPWLARCAEYQVQTGIRIPVNCSVEWLLPDGPLPYWRGRVVRARYDFAE